MPFRFNPCEPCCAGACRSARIGACSWMYPGFLFYTISASVIGENGTLLLGMPHQYGYSGQTILTYAGGAGSAYLTYRRPHANDGVNVSMVIDSSIYDDGTLHYRNIESIVYTWPGDRAEFVRTSNPSDYMPNDVLIPVNGARSLVPAGWNCINIEGGASPRVICLAGGETPPDSFDIDAQVDGDGNCDELTYHGSVPLKSISNEIDGVAITGYASQNFSREHSNPYCRTITMVLQWRGSFGGGGCAVGTPKPQPQMYHYPSGDLPWSLGSVSVGSCWAYSLSWGVDWESPIDNTQGNWQDAVWVPYYGLCINLPGPLTTTLTLSES